MSTLPSLPPPADERGAAVALELTPVRGGLHSGGGQRSDAVRNRARLLDAAARLASERGAANLTMDAVAAAASVGKGTVFRHFGDRTGLLLALLDQAEQRLQAAFLHGPPPVGPGPDAMSRLQAFGPAVLRHEHAYLDLYLAAVAEPTRRFRVPSYRVRLTHVAMLIRQRHTRGDTGDTAADTTLLAHTLLGFLDTALTHHLVEQQGAPLTRLETGWADLVDRLCR